MKTSTRDFLSLARTVVFLVGVSALSLSQSAGQTKKGRAPKANPAPKAGATKSTSPRQRATVTLNDKSTVTGELVKSDRDIVQLMVAGNLLTIKWSEISNLTILPAQQASADAPNVTPPEPGSGASTNRPVVADRLFTGTYRLDARSIPDVAAVINRSIPGLPAEQVQQESSQFIGPFITSEFLALEKRGINVAFGTSTMGINRFTANGSELKVQTEQRAANFRAEFEGKHLSVSIDFSVSIDSDTEIKVKCVFTYEPSADGQHMDVVTRIDLSSDLPAAQPMVFQTRYDRILETADWSKFSSAQASPNQQGATTTFTTPPTARSAVSKNSVLSIQVGIVYKRGGPEPVARVNFYLLDEDLSKILNDAGLQLNKSLDLVEGHFYDVAMAAIRPHIISETSTGFDGRAQFAPLEAGTYYLMGIAPTRGGFAIWNLRMELKPGTWSAILDQNNAALAL